MNKDRPAISVIIPTHNRCDSLRRMLDALCTQTYPVEQMEVLVVADGCIDASAEMLTRYAAPFALRVIEQSGQGPAAARNHGAADATGRLFVFLDDDIEPAPCLIEAHARAHQRQAGQVVIGYLPPILGGRTDFFSIALRGWWEKMFHVMRERGHRYTYRDLLSGNFSLEAELFTRVGGFDPSFRCHEDYELGVRLINAGATFTFSADALGYHHEKTGLNRCLQRMYDEGQADVLMGRRYPELRSTLRLVHTAIARSVGGRILRQLAFRCPRAGDVAAACVRSMLSLLERTRLRSLWRRLLDGLLYYWYWRGAAKVLGTQRALADFLYGAPARADKFGIEIEIDLREGLEIAEQRLDERRPAGARIRYGRRPVGRIPPMLGAERLRGVHLRPILATDLAWLLHEAMVLEDAFSKPIDADQSLADFSAQSSESVCGSYGDESPRPMKVLDIELSEEVKPVWGLEGYDALRILVRYHERPVGWTYIHPLRKPVVSAELLRETIAEQLGWELVQAVHGRQLSSQATGSTPLPPISVVVCTRDRADHLKRCLDVLLALDYPDYEIIVVDNGSRSDDTARLIAQLPVRYVLEKRPGLNWARNRGIAEARHNIIAFTDGDARPDHSWLQAISCAFAEPEVMAVTGLVAPSELETRAQIHFEFDYGGMGRGLRRRIIRRDALTDGELLWASVFGVGINMAFRRDLFAAIGSFDVALDVDTPSAGGGDIEMFHRLVARGYNLVYEPAALVWHTHPRNAAALRQLLYNSGRGFGAYLLTCARNRTISRFSILRFAVRQWLGWDLLRRLYRPGKLPRHLVALEMAGALLSLLAYKAARTRSRQVVAASHELDVRRRTIQGTLP